MGLMQATLDYNFQLHLSHFSPSWKQESSLQTEWAMPRCFEKQGMEARERSRGSSVSMRCITKPSAEEEFQERRKEKDPGRDHKYWANSISQFIVEIKNKLWRDKGQC